MLVHAFHFTFFLHISLEHRIRGAASPFFLQPIAPPGPLLLDKTRPSSKTNTHGEPTPHFYRSAPVRGIRH